MSYAWLGLQLLGLVAVIAGVAGLLGLPWALIVGGALAAVVGEVKS